MKRTKHGKISEALLLLISISFQAPIWAESSVLSFEHEAESKRLPLDSGRSSGFVPFTLQWLFRIDVLVCMHRISCDQRDSNHSLSNVIHTLCCCITIT